MKLSEYATMHGIKYQAAWKRFKAGKIPGAFKDEVGTIIVPSPLKPRPEKTIIYARVSSNKQKDDLERQVQRLKEFARGRGLSIDRVVTEIASGVNDQRPKLTKLLKEDDWTTLLIEHRDRLTRVGFNWFELFLTKEGKSLLVTDSSTEENIDLMDDFLSIIYSFAARLYGLRSARATTRRVAENLGVQYD